MRNPARLKVHEYTDSVHAEVLDDLQIGEFGYKYRLIDGVVMPPYITPDRYRFSRRLITRPGDVCYTSYPKSGSTWLAYILWLILKDREVPEEETLRSNLHWVASSWTYPRSESELEALPSPRIFKSHMPFQMAVGGDPLEAACKYVYIARNPKDVAVSYFYFEREKSWSGYYQGSWEHWLKIFLEGKVQRGSWFDHVLSWWRHRNSPNIHFLTYERLLRDFQPKVRELGRFLGVEISDSHAERIREQTSFKRMQEQSFSNMHEIKEFSGFFRKGEIGTWKERFTVAQSEAFDRILQEKLGGTGLGFEFE